MPFVKDDDWGDHEYERRRDLRLDDEPTVRSPQLSQLNAHAARLGQSADTLRDLCDRVVREDDMATVHELLSDVISELSTIHRHTERSMQLCTDMHAAIKVQGAV